MKRRPNAGGGKHNKQNKNISTRARFSNWKPPSKNIKEKFANRGNKKEIRDTDSGSKQNFKSGLKLTEKESGNTPLEVITIPVDFIRSLSRLFGILEDKQSVPSDNTHSISDTPDNKKSNKSSSPSNSTLPFAVVRNPRQLLSVEEQNRQNHLEIFAKIGFTTEEIFTVLLQLKPCASKDEVFLSLIQSVLGHTLLANCGEPCHEDGGAHNEELLTEVEVLESIYNSDGETESSIYCEHIILFDRYAVTRIQVTLCTTNECGYCCPVRVVVFITGPDLYPADGSALYGWLIPSDAVDFQTDSGENTSSSYVSAIDARGLSLRVMDETHKHMKQFCAPVVFDFLQSISEELPMLFSSPPVTVSLKYHKENSPRRVEGSAIDKSTDMKPAQSEDNLNEADKHIGVPAPLIRPTTCVMQGEEYRAAYGHALSSGLHGMAARKQARDALQHVLPSSELEALILEEKYAADLLERKCSIENIDTRQTIEGARVIAERLHVNKAQAKHLYAAGKEALMVAGDWFAPDQDTLREKVISAAVRVHREQLERKEAKRQEKLKAREELNKNGWEGKERGRRRRGPTIRDAYCSRRDGNEDGTLSSESDEGKEEVEDNDYTCNGTGYVESQVSSRDIKKEQEELDNKKRRNLLESRRMRNNLDEKRKSKKYQEILTRRRKLPAYQMRDRIVREIESNSVVVISGDTGCGKTTQIPQLIMDACIDKGVGAECNIIVTQPRRISAVSVSEHIARERLESIGQSTGYHIRLEAKKGPSTRLLLMTTGVLLRQLQVKGDLDQISHVFVDEVHERDINTDFLLIVLKRLLLKRPDLKIILMSATLNADLFVNYFRDGSLGGSIGGVSLVSIPGRAFPVSTYYLEDALEHTGFEISPDSEYACRRSNQMNPGNRLQQKHYSDRISHIERLKRSRKYSDKTLKSIECADESVINLDLIQNLVLRIISNPSGSDGVEGAILIFVPGLSDIRNVVDCLKGRPELRGRRSGVRILPLHSSLSSHEQNLVFQVPPPGVRKVIVSTNISETSVTIEDVVYVIDTCLVKENSYDEESQMNVLAVQWISQANARQRRGRAGRVRSGVCYHLASSFTVNSFTEFSVPEMLRMSLEDLVLQVLALDLGDPYEFLSGALSPPECHAVTNAIVFLESLGAVYIENLDTSAPEVLHQLNNGTLDVPLLSGISPLGYHLAALPVSPRIGKLMLYGVLLKCIDPILTISSMVSMKSPFVVPFNDKDAADAAKLNFLDGNSDLISMLNAFSCWKKEFVDVNPDEIDRRGGKIAIRRDEDVFCRSNFLSPNSLQIIDQMRCQFLGLLQSIGFISHDVTPESISKCSENLYGGNVGVVKCVICAGLSPNIIKVPPSASGNKKHIVLNKALQDISLLTRKKHTFINVHPSSIISSVKSLDSRYMAFVDAMKTSKVYAKDVSTVQPLSLALFCGKVVCREQQGEIVVDGWIKFSASVNVIRCITRIRDTMEEAFIAKVLDPSTESSKLWNKVLVHVKDILDI